MRLPSVPTLPMVEHLNSAYFHRVWNAPDDHGRANFKIHKAAKRLQIGAVPVNLSVVALPTTDKVYAVYQSVAYLFGRFVAFPDNQWIKDTDIATQFGVSILAFSNIGRTIPAGHTYFKYDTLRSIVLVAIDKTYTSQCIGQSYPELYMTVYLDTTRLSPVVSQTYQISALPRLGTPIKTVEAAISAAMSRYPASTFVLVNGWFYDPINVPPLFNNDVVQIVSDPDIIGYCDLIVDDNETGYYSVKYQEYREILHIPKILNPTNAVITDDTITVAIFDPSTKRGLYGHRVDQHALESITHNDFSMSRSVLQGFQDGLGSTSVIVRLYIRKATRSQPLSEDVNHIADLYTLTDSEIKAHLANLSTKQITEWRADHLEQSAYLDLLYKFNGFTSSDILDKYVKAMGYFDVASNLAQSVNYYTYKGAQVEIQKPVRLYGRRCNIIVYADGRKVPASIIGLSDYTSHSFLLGFRQGSYVKVGTRIAVYITEEGLRTPQLYNPTEIKPGMLVDSDDYQLVEITQYDAAKSVWKDTTKTGYRPIPLSPGDYRITDNNNGTFTYTVRPNHYDKSFYLIPRCGLDTISYPLDDILASKEPIIIPLKTSDNTNKIIPLIGYTALEVYLNGYRLIEGVDYTCDPIEGDQDDVLQTLLMVSNTEYISLTTPGNILEVIVHGDAVVSRDRGYVISNMMYRSAPPMIWSNACGRAFVKGKLIESAQEVGNILVSKTNLTDGAPYVLEWSLPYGAAKLLRDISPVSDVNLRTRIDTLLGYTPITYPDTVLIKQLHALYSPYLAKIVSDVANGLLIIVDEPKDDQFLKQFAGYSLLYTRDPIIQTSNPQIDRRFVTLAAHYVNFAVKNPQQMILVQRLISLLLTPSKLAMKEVLL